MQGIIMKILSWTFHIRNFWVKTIYKCKDIFDYPG